MQPLSMLMFMVLVGAAVLALVVYRKSQDGNDKKEKFETEKKSAPPPAAADDDEVIVEVATAYKKYKKEATPADVRRVIREMRESGESAEVIVAREMERRAAEAKTVPTEEATVPMKTPSRTQDLMESSMMRRVEDELESIVNRIDGLLEEIYTIKNRQVSGPLTENAVETFVPYHPV